MRQAHIQGSRSTVLNPLGWLLAIVLTTPVACQFAHAEHWMDSVGLGAAAGLTLVLYLTAYVFFAFRDLGTLGSPSRSRQRLPRALGRQGRR